MSNYCSLQEAWGIETFKQPKKKKKRRKKKKEQFQNSRVSNNILENMVVNNAKTHPSTNTKQNIETMENQELEGYNSSDYDQYEIEYDIGEQDISALTEDNYTQNNEINGDEYYEAGDGKYEVVQRSSEYTTNNVSEPVDMDSVIMRMYDILERVENSSNTTSDGNMYDLMLFMFLGVFILFVVDYMYKIGTRVHTQL